MLLIIQLKNYFYLLQLSICNPASMHTELPLFGLHKVPVLEPLMIGLTLPLILFIFDRSKAFTHIHEILFSTTDKPKLLSQVSGTTVIKQKMLET